jgi:membrane protein
MNRTELFGILRNTFKKWLKDDANLRAGALTFFIILPLPTLLLLIITFFSYFYGPDAAQVLIRQISSVAGPAVANLFSELISSTGSPFTSVFSSIIVIGFSVGGAIGAFSILRETMDHIWDVKTPEHTPLWSRIRLKIVPFFIVSLLGLAVMASTAIATRLFNLIALYSINGTLEIIAISLTQIALSFGLSTFLLAIIYKMIPRATVLWQDVTLAAVVTGVAFTVTNYVFGSYIETFTITTVAGAAGALLIILLWIFVLNQIVLFGAELSRVYAMTVGTYSKLNLPEPLKRAGEKIEDFSKGKVVKDNQKPLQNQTINLHDQQTQTAKAREVDITQDAETQQQQENREDDKGSVEVSVKIKAPKKNAKK